MELINNNKTIYIDEEDLELYNNYKWRINKPSRNNKTYYLIRSYNFKEKNINKCKIIYFHREILNILDQKIEVDHINKNGLDNRKDNLRICSHMQNMWNMPKFQTNNSGYKGVSWNSRNSKWRARIYCNNKCIHLGYFITKEEAYNSYCEASKKYHENFGSIL